MLFGQLNGEKKKMVCFEGSQRRSLVVGKKAFVQLWLQERDAPKRRIRRFLSFSGLTDFHIKARPRFRK